jgi:hypothetical protein
MDIIENAAQSGKETEYFRLVSEIPTKLPLFVKSADELIKSYTGLEGDAEPNVEKQSKEEIRTWYALLRCVTQMFDDADASGGEDDIIVSTA